MTDTLIQFRRDGARGVARLRDGVAETVPGCATMVALANRAIEQGCSLLAAADSQGAGTPLSLDEVTLLCPIDHPDPAHVIVTGTGLTHLGSAEGRDKMHSAANEAGATDSMKMFRMGLEGGKPQPGEVGAQPEWFYKGDGSVLRATGEALASPAFALDGGEEPEIAGIYLIAPDGTPVRLGFALGNEFSDHVTERGNYLWLAHSKLRQAAIGPELLSSELPSEICGTSRIVRDGATLWEKPFLSGEANMSHTIANLEQHHFKYDLFCRPGDVHVHFFGTATASFADGIVTQSGDRFEIAADAFTLPLVSPLEVAPERRVTVRSLA